MQLQLKLDNLKQAMKKKPYSSNTNDCRIVMNWTPVGKRSIGRPKETWRRMVEKERDAFGWKSWA